MAASEDLHWLTIAEAGRLIRSGELSPVELAEATLEWIDRTADVTKAFVTVTGELALAEAKKAEKELRSGVDKGPFHGIGYSVKDLVAVKDVPMEVNSKLTKGFVPREDARVVKNMREAGGVCLGKVTTHEFAWGCVSGPARNPWDGEGVPGGSSGGSGAAVAGGQGFGSIGTDCACSVRNPAALNGVCGIRPTHGRVSTTGVVPVSLGMDTVGPLCRTVEDTAIMLTILSGHDPADRTTSTAPVPDWASLLESKPVEGLTIGVPTNFFFDHIETGVKNAVEAAIETIAGLGLKTKSIEIPHAHWGGGSLFGIVVAETAALHDEWLHSRASEFGVDVRVWAELGNLLLAKDYVRSQQIRTLLIREWEQAFEDVDLIIVPATAATSKPPKDHPIYIDVEYPDGYVEDILFAYCRYMMPISVAGLPSLVVPVGFSDDDLPVGMQIVAPAFDEETAFRVGHAYQQVTDWHARKPTRITEVAAAA